MSGFLQRKDKSGNALYFADIGPLVVAPMAHVNHKTTLKTVSDFSLREDDVIVVGYPKSGNNWVHHMVTMLKTGSTEIPPLFTSNAFHFLEGINSEFKLPPSDAPRVFLTHLPFRFLPRDVTTKKVKIVYLTRNPKDVFVSLYNHLKNAKLPIGYEGSWPQFFDHVLEHGHWYGHVLDHLKDWQSEIEAHPDHPIFHCNYEDTKEDTLGQVERLNQFLGTGVDRALCQEIVHTCRLDNMHVTRRHDKDVISNIWQWKEGTLGSFYRKGVVGDWKNWFTVAQNERFDELYETKMADYKFRFRYE